MSFFKIYNYFSELKYKKFYKQYKPIINSIQYFDQKYKNFNEIEIKNNTKIFFERFKKGETLDQLLPEAFATVINATKRLKGKTINVLGVPIIWDMIPYETQIIAGIALYKNKIAQMQTGEGKTLAATLPLYLNSITGKNCQLATINEYLAKRDSEWMGYLYNYLGLSVGYVDSKMSNKEKILAYNANITYSTFSELGFDYLRDNSIAISKENQVQKNYYFCIIDEIDSILIDEARTPLVISNSKNINNNNINEKLLLDLKNKIIIIVSLQEELCDNIMDEILFKPLLDENNLYKLLKVKIGMPKNKKFKNFINNNENKAKLEKFEININRSFNREKLFKLKESLYFTLENNYNGVYLTDKGRIALSPFNDQDKFIIPDLYKKIKKIKENNKLSLLEKKIEQEKAENIYLEKIESINYINKLLQAYCIYEKNVSYIIKNKKIIIIDPNTGRPMENHKWGDCLHQAVEAKESLPITNYDYTHSSITIQNYFRLYEKLAGMTATAETEEKEFYDIYNLDVIPIPTHKKCIRNDIKDKIFYNKEDKYKNILQTIKQKYLKKQPVLVGTSSVAESELLSNMLNIEFIPHNILNANRVEDEAFIISKAGQIGNITISTNMSGRGTDIKIDEKVKKIGGLCVIGTERNYSIRVDLQLRGRAGRQGDPGESLFYLSLEDKLINYFPNLNNLNILSKLFKYNYWNNYISNPLLNISIEKIQKKIEFENYNIRKKLLEYDNVLNLHRSIIYKLRNNVLKEKNIIKIILGMIYEEMINIKKNIFKLHKKFFNHKNLVSFIEKNFFFKLKEKDFIGVKYNNFEDIVTKKIELLLKEKNINNIDLDELRKNIINIIDIKWQKHLYVIENLKFDVSLKNYSQETPIDAYKNEAFIYFNFLISKIRKNVILYLYNLL